MKDQFLLSKNDLERVSGQALDVVKTIETPQGETGIIFQWLSKVCLAIDNDRQVSGILGVPANMTKAPALLLVHEWWGLNDHIKSVVAGLTARGYLTLAVDLYDGKVATTPEEVRACLGALKMGVAHELILSGLSWLRGHELSTGQLGIIGWCFGTGLALDAAIEFPVAAIVLHYGDVARHASQLEKIAGPVLGHFAIRDEYVPNSMVENFEREMALAHKPASVYYYDAEHAFANLGSQGYDRQKAVVAWTRTLTFLEQILRNDKIK
jgi:carboxymethylenebutenolidase